MEETVKLFNNETIEIRLVNTHSLACIPAQMAHSYMQTHACLLLLVHFPLFSSLSHPCLTPKEVKLYYQTAQRLHIKNQKQL
ncbi:hypothetical protein ACTXT7_016111 [Hymenolepis weldensis]